MTKQAAYLPQIPGGGSAKGRIDQATICLALWGGDTGAFEVFSAFSGALSQGVQFSDKADQGKEYKSTEDGIEVVHRGFRLLHRYRRRQSQKVRAFAINSLVCYLRGILISYPRKHTWFRN